MSRAGVPNFEPTAKEREDVLLYSMVALTHEQMALLIRRPNAEGVPRPISVDTLTRHFAEELETGKAQTIAQVAGRLLRQAVGLDTRCAVQDEQRAAFFILKTKGGFRETDRLEVLPVDAEGERDDTAAAARVAGLLEKGRRQLEAKRKGGETLQ